MLKKTLLAIVSLGLFIALAYWFLSSQTEAPLVLGINQEETEKRLDVEGKFPDWLQGVLVRNSSIPIFQNGKQISHPFDGLAMLHGFEFRNGEVFYSNRFLLSDDYDQVVNKKNPHYGGFASTANSTIWEAIQNFFSPNPGIQNASVNVFQYGKKTIALTEVPLPVAFDLKTLQTLGSFHYQDDLPKARCWESAHPHLDFASKDIFNYLIEFGPESHYILYRIPNGSSSRKPIAKIPALFPSYMHSFAMTEHYLILTEFPLIINPLSLMQGKSLMQSMSWKPEQRSRFLVVNKQSGEIVAHAETDPFFSFHHANAYESGEDLVIDLVAYPDVSMMTEIFPEAPVPSDSQTPYWKSRLMRYRYSLPRNEIVAEIVLEKELEFPRLDDRLDGKPYRYLYLTLSYQGSGGLVKVDQQTRAFKTYLQEDSEAVEPIFVPAPGATLEDDGVILTIAFNRQKESSYLLALDGQTFEEIGRAKLPFPIPDSFHGQFFRESTFIPKK